MIRDRDPYVMLMASLPAIGLLSEREPPINPTRLAERLGQLAPAHGAELERVRSILSWDRLAIGDDDPTFLERAAAVIARIESPALRAAVEERLEIRTVLAALGRRHAGEDAPAADTPWGFGRHVAWIRANWSVPDFGLGRTYPWLPAAREMLEKGDSAGLERLVLETVWNAITRRAAGHAFDFEAVAFYLMRWSLAERWAGYDADAASLRFGEMLDAAMDAPAEEAA